MRRLDRRFRNNIYTNVKENQRQNSKGVNFTVKEKMEKMNKGTIIQCREKNVLDIFRLDVQIFLENKTRAIISLSLMMRLTKKINMTMKIM